MPRDTARADRRIHNGAGIYDLLDEFDGRFVVTPEYLAGSYASHATLESDRSSFHPCVVGPEYRDVANAANFTTGQVAIGPPPGCLPCPGGFLICAILLTDLGLQR